MMPKLNRCPECEGAGGDCLLCNGEGQVTDFDLISPRATKEANLNRRKYQDHARRSTAEVLVASYKPTPEKAWSKAPADCRTTLVAFAEEWPECIPMGSKAFLIKTARKLVGEVGEIEAPKFVSWASTIIKNSKQELMDGVKSLDSFSFLIGKWRRERGDRCPECGEGSSGCRHEWGSKKREEKYRWP